MSTPPQITCREFQDFLLDYCEGQLGDEPRAVFEHHLARCPMCRVHFETYLKAIELGRRVLAEDDPDAPADLPEELVEAVLAARAVGGGEPP
jgi:predicted anti-sigma-YlaC factor YlaD